MAGRLLYGKRVHYAHMFEEEMVIWERYMDMYPDRFETVDYDFRVGEGMIIPEGTEENISRMARMLSQKRIDVIGWVGDSPTIIEIKNRAGLSTLGQILGYKILFEKYFPQFETPALEVVCEMISQDDLDVLEANEIPVEVV